VLVAVVVLAGACASPCDDSGGWDVRSTGSRGRGESVGRWIVTAAHVVPRGEARVVGIGPTEVEWMSPTSDVALLRVENYGGGPRRIPAPVRRVPLVEGTPVTVRLAHRNIPATAVDGRSVALSDGWISRGDSGSGVFDHQGRLVGLIRATYENDRRLADIVPASAILYAMSRRP